MHKPRHHHASTRPRRAVRVGWDRFLWRQQARAAGACRPALCRPVAHRPAVQPAGPRRAVRASHRRCITRVPAALSGSSGPTHPTLKNHQHHHQPTTHHSAPNPQNQLVWVAGEPAFLKIWLRAPVTAALDDSLDAEEGFSPDLAAAAMEGWLRRCGVGTEGFKRGCWLAGARARGRGGGGCVLVEGP